MGKKIAIVLLTACFIILPAVVFFTVDTSQAWVTAGRNVTLIDSVTVKVNTNYLKQLKGINSYRSVVDLLFEWSKKGTCETVDFVVLSGGKFDSTARMSIVNTPYETGALGTTTVVKPAYFRLQLDSLQAQVDTSFHLSGYGYGVDTVKVHVPVTVPANAEYVYIKTKWTNAAANDSSNTLRINAW